VAVFSAAAAMWRARVTLPVEAGGVDGEGAE
jgi:hypothetical protein